LEQLTAETGGRTFFPAKEDDLEGSFQEIAQELRSQYSIGYISTNKKKDGTYRNIQIKISNKDYRARHKKGYYAPKS
jgi:VWFA-related protein